MYKKITTLNNSQDLYTLYRRIYLKPFNMTINEDVFIKWSKIKNLETTYWN